MSRNDNFFSAYQAYIEYVTQKFPFALRPSYQEWSRTFFGENTESLLDNFLRKLEF